MIGRLYIDGKDAYVNYGVFVTAGGYNELVASPPMKEVSSVDWAEYNGVDVDLSAPRLDTKELAISFAAHGIMRVREFFALLSDGVYHTFDFRDLGRVFKLRLLSETTLNQAHNLKLFTLRFANDFPLPDGYIYQPPQSTLVAQTGYKIDGRSLADYGVYILQGSKNYCGNLCSYIACPHG